MVQFNFSERTIKAKVVYYGPPQSGKTTNLEQIHRITDPAGANRLISLNTAQDRTLFFDLLPFSLGTVSGYDFKVQLYTVPGQVQYNATRRVVLAGADAVVFVADSQKTMARENQSSFENMKVNLLANRLIPEKVPLVLQYNKQDLDSLLTRAELDRVLNFWGRKAFPAVASRGDGVIETFVAVVQDMLTAIAVKYNLKEKGLDPEAVPGVVGEAFETLLRGKPAVPAGVEQHPAPSSPAAPPSRVVVAQPSGAEPAYPGQLGPEANPVSEELLHRAIRSNVDLAEMLGQIIRELTLGLGTIQAQSEILGSAGPGAPAAAAIHTETARLRRILQDLGRNLPSAAGASAGPQGLPDARSDRRRQASVTQRAAAPPPAAPARPVVTAGPPPAASLRAGGEITQPGPAPPGATLIAGSATTLDGLLSELALALRPPLGMRDITIENQIKAGTSLPRCSPASLRRTLVAFLQGLAVVVEPASTISARALRKPVLLRGRDGGEVKRDFLMLSLTHSGGLEEADQQRILKGADRSAVGEGQRLLREMGGFLRFAPLPGGNLETRLFLPV